MVFPFLSSCNSRIFRPVGLDRSPADQEVSVSAFPLHSSVTVTDLVFQEPKILHSLLQALRGQSPLLSALQPWLSLGLLYSQSPLLSALQPWVSLCLLYSQSRLVLALQPLVSFGLLYSQSPLLSALQPWVSLGLLYGQSPLPCRYSCSHRWIFPSFGSSHLNRSKREQMQQTLEAERAADGSRSLDVSTQH
jgi:hypothetical protein